jgi:hypothetical protein
VVGGCNSLVHGVVGARLGAIVGEVVPGGCVVPGTVISLISAGNVVVPGTVASPAVVPTVVSSVVPVPGTVASPAVVPPVATSVVPVLGTVVFPAVVLPVVSCVSGMQAYTCSRTLNGRSLMIASSSKTCTP